MWAMIVPNRLEDSVDGEHGRVKTTLFGRSQIDCLTVDGKHGRVKTETEQ